MSTPSPPFNTYGTTSTGSGALTPTNVDQLAALSGILTGLQTTQIDATGQANAAAETAAGAAAEAGAYGSAGQVAQQNEAIAGIAGEIALFQQQRQVAATVGQATAAAGAGGTLTSGSAYDVIQSSYQQGAIGGQVIQVQTALDQGGYAEEYQATQAEVAAANAQAAAANTEATAYSSEASLAAQQTAQLNALYAPQVKQVNNLTTNPTSAVGGKDSQPYTAYAGNIGAANPNMSGKTNIVAGQSFAAYGLWSGA